MPESNPSPQVERPLGLFEAYGVELEYMLVSAETLDVAPAADRLLEAVAGELTDEYENGDVAWNNELALHVIEFKCNGPRPSLAGLADAFQRNVGIALAALRRDELKLMPGAMHPWMDPLGVELWPHGAKDIYETFDRIFGCKGHGWANLQSAHLNLPFSGDAEFGRLHAAIRLLLPTLPGLAASSPVIDGAVNGTADNRLVVYRGNCARIPSITGEVIPEPIYSMEEYHERLLERLYADLAPYDPEGILRREWVNARGAIARFERKAIEIRVLDIQECPAADLALMGLIVDTLKSLCEERWADLRSIKAWPTRDLARLLRLAERRAEQAEVGDGRYLEAFGLRRTGTTLAGLWEHLIESAASRGAIGERDGRILEHFLRRGTLATRIMRALGAEPKRPDLERVYGRLCDALATGTSFGDGLGE
ncbi:MAG TPA: glutamate-cysteine ligase family protein [Gammaproteobacteria bacterium]|nr:glutamate-cysteine ligase family protein [Gammaproteobacteria bacterium]